LELTESLFAGGSPQKLKQTLEALKATGVCLAIDDFGTGYSSLSYLRGFPFDKLKIDRAFVHGIETDPDQRRLLKGIVELAHALGLRTVAEGAETAGEVALLTDMRVDEIQGYYFSRPAAAREAMKTIQELNRGRRASVRQPGQKTIAPSSTLRTA
jgi:EAL domain-containing protein (putative c-di-GMP-specific phosphodiesterase class I)